MKTILSSASKWNTEQCSRCSCIFRYDTEDVIIRYNDTYMIQYHEYSVTCPKCNKELLIGRETIKNKDIWFQYK